MQYNTLLVRVAHYHERPVLLTEDWDDDKVELEDVHILLLCTRSMGNRIDALGTDICAGTHKS